ncbi:MAG: hypothetical protein ATN33_03085 [Epulopiscium sp. Nele67-Bin001]|nr:MAG: hypothetical protein BEN18_11005 [Epulopiscium sp. Nuni2H_MBin001]OON90396.1 MAG: hypothetical protein ATN33_03085 [Epulopiscium sp. Nele67-Bin001]
MKNEKKALEDYIDVIMQLPLKEKYTKEELLVKPLLIDSLDNIEIYYAPHNDYINKEAKIFIVGITPGFLQMDLAISTARRCLEQGMSIEAIKKECKLVARFSGPLRKNLISMLDEIGLHHIVGLACCEELFSTCYMHTTSVIPYPTFVNGTNYTGHSPKLIKNEFLMSYAISCIKEELQQLKYTENILIVPLGKAVEEVLFYFASIGLFKPQQILQGFPHPSGANGNRIKQLEANKHNLITQLKGLSAPFYI